MTTLKTRLLSVLLLFIASLAVMSQAQTLDTLRAIANDDVITAQEVERRIAMVKRQYRNNPSVLPSDEVLDAQILETLIVESLQKQLAERLNIVIPEQQIDEAIAGIATRQNLSLPEFVNRLKRDGQSIDTFREQIRQEITLNQLQRTQISRQVFVSDAEVNRFLNTQSGQTLTDTRYTLSYLRFTEDERAEAEALLTQLTDDGGALLDQPGARDLGPRNLQSIPSLFKTLVPVLAPLETKIIDDNGTLHMIQLAEKSEQETVNITEHKVRHILVTTNALFDENASRQLISDLKTQIENGASMAELADQFSEDSGSKGVGGDLGWNSLDNFVPEFAATARSLPTGELSDIVETQFGFHILRVEDVRTRNVGVDVIKNRIKNQLGQTRYNELLETWLAELRAESYVEFRNP